MNPAPSVILFTVLSGLGFGLLAWLGIGFPDVYGWSAFAFFFIGFGLAISGLLAATFHLGNPKNALKAFSQWHSSWLSREAWASAAALSVMGLYAFLAVFFDVRVGFLGWIGAVLCVATVFTTSMIYTQIKAVPRWHQKGTIALFLVSSLAGGALLAGQVLMAGILLACLGIVQVVVWVRGDTSFERSGSTMETATGLGHLGKVRLFEPPHTGGNYLLTEMVYVVGRKHAAKLRMIAIVLMSLIPALVLLLFPIGHLGGFVVVLIHLVGMFASRWLFFSEAEHVVGLYYGKR